MTALACSVQVTVKDDTLVQRLTAENTGQQAFDYTAALHTYYTVSDISQVGLSMLCSLLAAMNVAGAYPFM